MKLIFVSLSSSEAPTFRHGKKLCRKRGWGNKIFHFGVFTTHRFSYNAEIVLLYTSLQKNGNDKNVYYFLLSIHGDMIFRISVYN